jgi:hypothetical protein
MVPRSKAVIAVVIAAAGMLFGCSQNDDAGSTKAPAKKVLLIARENSADMALMIGKEVDPIIQDLTAAGFDVTIASDPGTDITSGQTTLKVNASLAEVNVAEYVGLIIPCMAAGGTVNSVPPAAVDIVSKENQKGAAIAAEQSGVQILGAAGVLQGRKYAIGSGGQDASWGGSFQGSGVVVDGTIVTSGTCPYMESQGAGVAGTPEMTADFIALLPK